MKKSIAIICEYILIPERIGGMDRFFVAYDKALKKKGYKVTWFFKNVAPFDFYKDLTIVSASNKDIENFFLNHCKSKQLQFDIVITHFLQPISSFYKMVKKLMNPYIISVDHNPRPIGGFTLKKQLKNKIKGLLYGKYVDKLVGVSAYTTNYILKDFSTHLKHKADTVYNGIDVTAYKKQQLDRTGLPIRFLIVSHLRESKGIQDLLTALYKIDRGLLKNIHIDIYGNGPYKKELLVLQKKYELEEIVNFKGSSSKLNELFYNYHYLIQPTYMECFSLSILESLASNVPVITTTVGGNLEVIEDGVNGFIFEPKNVNALAKIIENIVLNKTGIENDVSTKIENEFTLDIMVANHLKLLACT